jgi:phosphoserine phosphatase RsbU/P
MPAAIPDQRQIRVLLIDDQSIVGETVRRMLAPETDIEFRFCQDPTEAVPAAAEWLPTVILQDLVMPEVDGLSLVKFFRIHPKLKDVPLIVLSSNEEPATRTEAFSLGANDYLLKLPDRDELVARIRYHSTGYIHLLQRNELYQSLLESRQELADTIARTADCVRSLLPKSISSGDIEVDWRYVPGRSPGDNIFGYYRLDEDHFAIYLLGFKGDGAGSALQWVSALNLLRASEFPGVDFRRPEAVLSRMNSASRSKSQNRHSFTMWYCVYCRSTRTLRHAGAGHPPAFLTYDRQTASVLPLSGNSFPAELPDATWVAAETEMRANSRLYIFANSVMEIKKPDGSLWSIDELQTFLRRPVADPDSEIEELCEGFQQMHGCEGLKADFFLIRVNFK